MTNRILSLTLLSTTALAQPGPGGPGGPGGGQGDGIWRRNAYFGENQTFDACTGHQPGSGDYHHHANPVCLRAQLGDNLGLVRSLRTGVSYREKAAPWTHSPILGWAFDGYPIYGPYGYSDPKSATSAVRRMRTSFRLRTITERTSLPDWLAASHAPVPQKLDPSQYGPPVNAKFPLGRYQEDFDYVESLGDLDQYNGRFTVTPEFPSGVYAYFVTIDADGQPAFPYILSRQYYGAVAATPPGPGPGIGSAQQVPADATDYFAGGQLTGPVSTDAVIASFPTKNSRETAKAVIGWDPSEGPRETWPATQPARAMPASGGVTAPTSADVQRIRVNAGSVYVNSNGLPSHPFGPWFASGNGGVFNNFPARQNYQLRIPRAPTPATGTRTTTPMGAAGIWVNGVALFNALDGGSYKTSTGADAGGGPVNATAIHRAAPSLEGGPVTPGSIVTAFANFGAVLAASTDAAPSPQWPLTLGGSTVTIVDAAGGAMIHAVRAGCWPWSEAHSSMTGRTITVPRYRWDWPACPRP